MLKYIPAVLWQMSTHNDRKCQLVLYLGYRSLKNKVVDGDRAAIGRRQHDVESERI